MLPVKTVWTTNYDDLTERAFQEAGRITDVKRHSEDFALSQAARDVVIYKMHGDWSCPNRVVLTKEDCESYDEHRKAFATTLLSDLATRTFLCVGFGGTDRASGGRPLARHARRR